MAEDIRTYAVAPDRRRRRLIPALGGLLALIVLAVALLLITAGGEDSSDGSAPEREASVETTVVGHGRASRERTPEGAARSAAGYLIEVGQAAVGSRPDVRRAIVEEWVVPERMPQELASFEAVHRDLSLLLLEAGAQPSRMTTRAVPLGYRVLDFASGRARVEIWQVFTVLGAAWPGSTSWSTTEALLRWTSDGWRLESGSEGLEGPVLPGDGATPESDSGALARRVEQFIPFGP